jgi:preprotein translocase subunit SecG
MLPIVINILLVIHVLVSLLIILTTLMQRPKNEGLGAAFGGGMTENLFGAQTTNVLQNITRWLGAGFFALTLLLSYLYVKQSKQGSAVSQKLRAKAAAAPAVAPADAPKPNEAGQPSEPEKPTPDASKANTEAPAASEPAKPEQTATPSSETPEASEKTSGNKPSDAPAAPQGGAAQEQQPAAPAK